MQCVSQWRYHISVRYFVIVGPREPCNAAQIMASHLSIIPLTGIGEIKAGDNLAEHLCAGLARQGLALEAGDVIVIAQKIVSKSEGRTRRLSDICPDDEAKRLAAITGKDARLVQAVLDESHSVMRAKPHVLIVRHKLGLVMANAGIDQSNLPGDADQILLLPADPDASAKALRAALAERTGAAIGIIISDSFGRAWRNGTVNVAIGLAGVPAVFDQRGEQDREGRELMVTITGHADALAAAAGIVMGEAAEGVPAVLLRGQLSVGEGRAADLIRPLAEDMFP